MLLCFIIIPRQDDESFQAKFNSLIELNQANRGDLVRSPSRQKLATFIAQLNEQGHDPTSLWYFLSIHDNILFPLVEFMQFKRSNETRVNNNKRSLMNTVSDDNGWRNETTAKRPCLE